MSVTKAIELLDIWINFYSKGGGRAHGPDQAALEKIRAELERNDMKYLSHGVKGPRRPQGEGQET
jgi:hypothetical protein